jgi:hypothetical protein
VGNIVGPQTFIAKEAREYLLSFFVRSPLFDVEFESAVDGDEANVQ